MTYQFYWPNWWRLWPTYNFQYDSASNYLPFTWKVHTFCIGPLQVRWLSQIRSTPH